MPPRPSAATATWYCSSTTCPTTWPCCTMRSTNPATPCCWPRRAPPPSSALPRPPPNPPPPPAQPPIIFMTGPTDTEHLVAALAAGGIDYVTKPIKPREVMARMGVHLGAARQARQDASQARQARNALD